MPLSRMGILPTLFVSQERLGASLNDYNKGNRYALFTDSLKNKIACNDTISDTELLHKIPTNVKENKSIEHEYEYSF